MFRLQTEIWLPQPLDEVFTFFSDAHNLNRITPPWLHFHILTPAPIEMRHGTRIDYRLKLRGIPLRWQSEITVWEPPHRFVDEQRRGPYRVWIHEHIFESKDGGTSVRDLVQYTPAGGVLVNRLFVARDVKKIFEFRARKLREIFGWRIVHITLPKSVSC